MRSLRGRSPGTGWCRGLLWLGAATLLAACSPHLELYPQLETLARAGQYEQAAKLVEENEETYGERNAVLYHLDRGVYYHYAGRYEESNRAFEAAERRIDELYAESISGNIAAFALNDNALPYKGEDFEAVVINLYRALNYAQLGDPDAALVEARKVNLKLEQINRQYDDDAKNVYKEDAFARLLAGILYERGGTRDDLNDAFISNRIAANVYASDFAGNYGVGAPEVLGHNLISTAGFMGPEELEQAREVFPNLDPLPLAERQAKAQVYFVHFAGKGPVKVEDAIRAIMPDGNRIKIAFPRYAPSYYVITGAQVLVDGTPATTLQTAQPIGAIAVKNLENRKGRIAAKAIARVTAKYLANRAVQERAKQESQAAGLFAWAAGQVFAEVSEQADLRAWLTLPDRVLIGRAVLEPGSHDLQVQFTSDGGAVVTTKELGPIEAQAGEIRFVILHTLQ